MRQALHRRDRRQCAAADRGHAGANVTAAGNHILPNGMDTTAVKFENGAGITPRAS